MQEENKKSDIALREENILKFWKENDIFSKTIENRNNAKEFIFYEGPPTANGKPGIHHLEARAFKDAIPRYKTMRGYHVRRKGGWDTHGLPVELQVEKKLGLDSKKAIEEYGIAKFNKECKESVWEYLEFWNKFTERIGFWVDQKNPYVTYHNSFIESVWNVIKEADKQKLLYKDYKVVPWCPRCGTALSSHELAQGYQDVKDLSVYVKFKLKPGQKINNTPVEENTFILAWTTTPWTLPGNVALAIGKDIDYVKIEYKDSMESFSGNNQSKQTDSVALKGFYILAKDRISILLPGYKIIEEIKGKELIGLEYESLYPFLQNTISDNEKLKLEKAFKVYEADFVTTEDGTGVVHTAVMYGQDDFVLGTEIGLPKHHLVGLDGKFLPGTGFLENKFVRDEDTAVEVIKDLAHRNLLLKKEKYEHSYPHCWRCKTALIYYARDSWYVRMSDKKIKNQLIEENKSINWEPSHIQNGRFGEWLKDIKDWAISRERYWGTPLPVWSCDACKEVSVLGSLEDIKSKTKKSGNNYFIMRHGGAESNINGIISSRLEDEDHLTKAGTEQVYLSAENLKKEKIDLVIYSPFFRTKETALIAKEVLHIKNENFLADKRIVELSAGVFDGKKWDDYFENRGKTNWFLFKPEGGESCKEMKHRMTSFLYDLEEKYQNKNILIVTHEGPARALIAGSLGYDEKTAIKHLEGDGIVKFKNAQVEKLNFVTLPHNEDFELDLHKPFIDEINLYCDCGGKLIRTKEVMDVWFDSGAMPFAQDHYPFENKDWVEGLGYPADFISEAIDQTRGWFYTLHAIGVIMGRGKAFKNVICLGHLLDAKGKKMSKSLGNVIDPWEMMDKYGVDTLRLWMYAINQPGESKNFDEKTVLELNRQVFGLLYNVLAFYELYRDQSLETETYKLESDSNILDKWILARLDEVIKNSTENLDNYKLLEPVRLLRDFIGDLSTWYLRRSRDRIKDGDKEAKKTLYFILKTLSKLMAPFAPFAAEDIWQKLKNDKDKESVHLEDWPEVHSSFIHEILQKFSKDKNSIIDEMQKTREFITLGLEARQKSGIKVRQPLGKLRIKNYELKAEYQELVKDELNVKEIVFDEKISNEIELDISISKELKEEGDYREFVRALQDMRKKMNLTPSDKININIDTNQEGKDIIQKFENDLLKVALISKISFSQNDGEELKTNGLLFKVKIDKI